MKVLSWDIGIKNLAFCLTEFLPNEKENEADTLNFEKAHIKVLKWDVINIQDTQNNIKTYNCEFTLPKKGKVCGKKAKHFEFGTWKTYCGTHIKKIECENTQLINKIKCNHILKNNTRCQKGIKFVKENGLEGYCSTHSKNPDISHLLSPIHKNTKYNLHQVSNNLIQLLDELNFTPDIDIILIENQPAFKNPKMKSIQMILYSYFLIRYQIDMKGKLDIHFMMANNKLKVKLPDSQVEEQYQKQVTQKFKTKYQRFKELAKKYCSYYLIHQESLNHWIPEYEKHQKKDDLADTFLMCVYYSQNSKKFKV